MVGSEANNGGLTGGAVASAAVELCDECEVDPGTPWRDISMLVMVTYESL